jgi:hypothetical protein
MTTYKITYEFAPQLYSYLDSTTLNQWHLDYSYNSPDNYAIFKNIKNNIVFKDTTYVFSNRYTEEIIKKHLLNFFITGDIHSIALKNDILCINQCSSTLDLYRFCNFSIENLSLLNKVIFDKFNCNRDFSTNEILCFNEENINYIISSLKKITHRNFQATKCIIEN